MPLFSLELESSQKKEAFRLRESVLHLSAPSQCSTLLQGVSGLLQSASSFLMRCQWSQSCSRMASWSKVLQDAGAKTAARIIDVSFFIIL